MGICDWFKKADPERPDPGPALVMMAPEPEKAPTLFMGSKFNEKRQWYGPAIQHFPKMPVVWKHALNYPKGLVVHFTAGHHNPAGTIDYGSSQGYLYDCMGPDGVIRQANPLADAGYHTGGGQWIAPNGVAYFGMHRYCRGLEITSAGQLNNEKVAWFKKRIEDSKVREIKPGEYKTARSPGFYEKYTPQQEDALISYCLWLKWNNPDVFDFDWVIGHEECSTVKNDPGGALSMDMHNFRALLKAKYQKLAMDTARL